MTFTGCEIIYSSILIHYNYQSAYWIPILLFIVIALLILLLPIKPVNIFTKINKNFFIKMVASLYVILFIIYTFSISSILLNNWFYFKTPLLVLILIFTITIIFLSKSPHILFYFAFFSGILVLLINFVPIFATTNRTFSLILPLKFRFENIYMIFSGIFILLDSILFLPMNNILKKPVNKFQIILTIFLGSLMWTGLIIDNYFFVMPEALKDSLSSGLMKYKIYTISIYMDNVDTILLINILYLLTMKCSIFLYLFRVYHKMKKNLLFILLTGICIAFFSYLIAISDANATKFGVIVGSILSGLIIIYYIFLQFAYRKKVKHE